MVTDVTTLLHIVCLYVGFALITSYLFCIDPPLKIVGYLSILDLVTMAEASHVSGAQERPAMIIISRSNQDRLIWFASIVLGHARVLALSFLLSSFLLQLYKSYKSESDGRSVIT